MTKNEILDKVAEMLNDVNESENTRISFNDIEDKIHLRQSIKNILKESKNEKLNSFLNNMLNELKNGKTESMLYESFISGVSNWNYLNAVDTELSAVNSRIDKYKQEIDFSKILNTMKNTTSAYIVPVIESCVLDYINNKTANNRVILTDRLMAFHYDPFVKDMLEVLHCDRSITESVNYKNEQIHNVKISKIYSPIYTISENECIFNVSGNFYNKKGNNISRINKQNISKLDEKFVNLCNIINSNNVRINEMDNIELTYGNKTAIISENAISIDNKIYTSDELNEAKGISYITNDGYVNFYNMAEYLLENYNSIAYIDFVKSVKSNKDDIGFDLFKLKESLYLTTHDTIGNHTFYRNINPIQTVNIINEHMNMNVSNMFEELQSDNKKIQHEIDETKKSYESYIAELEERKTKLESCKESADSDDISNIEEALKIVEDELEKTKNDYKEYQKTSDKFLNGDEGETDSDFATDLSTDGTDTDNDDADVASDNIDITATDDSVNKETSTDVETPILDINKVEDEDNKEDLFTYEPYFDETQTQDVDDVYAPKVVKVSYKSNIKTGQVTNTGEVHILIPSVNSNGDVTNELQRITFTLDKERNPIINNDYMPVAIYNIIKDAIEAEPMTSEVDVDSLVDEPANIDDEQPESSYAAPIETTEENPIDSVYGTDDIATDSPAAEPEDVKDLMHNDVFKHDDEDYTSTSDPEPLNLETVTEVPTLIELSIENDELIEQKVSPVNLKNYLSKYGIIATLDDKTLKVSIRNSEECEKFERYFTDYVGWTREQFFTFCYELAIYESYKPSKVVVKYSQDIENILEKYNLSYKISKRGDKLMIMNAVNEGVLITVTDDKTGKTIKINTDELNDNTETEEHENNTQGDVTFDDSENANNTSDDEDDNSKSKDNENNESTEDRPEAKKLMFRIKKRKTDESLGLTNYASLHESIDSPEVMDVVKYKNKTGNVVSKLNTGELIVQLDGHSEIIRPSQIKIVNNEFEMQDDLNESVNCGIFMNGFRITPNDCVTDINKYNNATDDDFITLVVEGMHQEIAKKYVKILS